MVSVIERYVMRRSKPYHIVQEGGHCGGTVAPTYRENDGGNVVNVPGRATNVTAFVNNFS